MTFAEIVVFVLVALALYFLLRPLHTRLEKFFYKFFRSRSRGNGTVIDITDSIDRNKK